MPDRECGDCTLCCGLVRVPELDKPAGETCKHVCEKGCGIYEERPRSCRSFECLWLKGELPDWAKPNQINVIFADSRVRINGGTKTVYVQEAEDGSADEPRVWELVQSYRDDGRKVTIIPRSALD